MKKGIVLSLNAFYLVHSYGATDFKLGIENLSTHLIVQLRNHPCALLTNQTGKDSKGNPTHEILLRHGISLKKIIVPEHGFDGKKAASQEVHDTIYKNLPVLSLYGNGSGKKIDELLFSDVQAIVIDLQDSGMRHYTYISTMYNVLEAAAACNKPVVIFDRPNPLGSCMEGPLVEPSLKSFISIAPIPLRHGMTIGELALFFNNHLLEKQAQLFVVPMYNYNRSMGLPQNLPAFLSPNITCQEACHGYSFLGLLSEIRPFNMALGTRYAFQGIYLNAALPREKTRWETLRANLEKLGIKACLHSYYNPNKKKTFRGLKFKIADIDTVSSWKAFIEVIAHFKKYGLSLRCSDSFDKAAGSRWVRTFIETSPHAIDPIRAVEADLIDFRKKAQNCFLYLPHPKLT